MKNTIKGFILKNDLNNPLKSYEAINKEIIMNIIGLLNSNGKKELDYSNKFKGYIKDILEHNFIPSIQKIPSISDEGIKKHYLTHIVLYFLGKKGIALLDINGFEYRKEDILNMILSYDKMSFIYDLYIMYIYGTEFNENIFNEEFLLKNNELINKHIDDGYIGQIQNGVDEFNIKEIVNLNLNNISRNDKKEFLLLEQVSDLLGLLDTGFKSNFEISSSLLYYDGPINGEVLPAYVIPIIYEIFGDKKSIKITKNNYEEIKNKFKSARVNYLTSLGIKDFSDKKEIKEKINIKTEQLGRINTYRIRNPENPDSKNKNIQEFQRKISLLGKTIKKNDK